MLDFDMGAYGSYVWPAWGISALVLAGLVLLAAAAARRWTAELKRLESEPSSVRPQAARSAVGPEK